MQQKTISQRLSLTLGLGALILSLFLAACGGSEPAAEEAAGSAAAETIAQETGSEAPTATTAAATTAEEKPAAPAAESEATEAKEEAVAAAPAVEVTCTALDIPDFDLVAGPTETDWAQGPETASITIIEYGDFQ